MSRSDFKQFDELDFEFRNSKGKVKPAPALPDGAVVADTHCHLGMLEDPGLALARAAHHGVRFVCCITDPARSEYDEGDPTAAETYAALGRWQREALERLRAWGESDVPVPRVRFACGVHPHNARLWNEAHAELERLLADPLTCCLGEIGLDYHYDLSPRDVQRDVFARQLRMAQERGLPVQLHLREAHDDALAILRREGVPQAGCIVHCFNLDAGVLAPFLELGCYIAFGGPLTFRKSWYTRHACLDVPFDHLLTETDAPYMAPEPLRGTACEPAQTVYTLKTLLDVHGFAGDERALELASPRQVDVENGNAQPREVLTDFRAVRAFFTEHAFADLVYANATGLLDS